MIVNQESHRTFQYLTKSGQRLHSTRYRCPSEKKKKKARINDMPELIMIENGKAKILGEFKAYWTFFFF